MKPLDAPDPGDRAEMIRITGRVQGVGFRASAQHLALQYGLRGWVANVDRGVVIHACGPAARRGFRDCSDRHAAGTPLIGAGRTVIRCAFPRSRSQR
jgi:hypothetical protein